MTFHLGDNALEVLFFGALPRPLPIELFNSGPYFRVIAWSCFRVSLKTLFFFHMVDVTHDLIKKRLIEFQSLFHHHDLPLLFAPLKLSLRLQRKQIWIVRLHVLAVVDEGSLYLVLVSLLFLFSRQ